MTLVETHQLSLEELTKLCALDSELYARTFFPRTFRQPSPPFAKDLWGPLEDPNARLVNLICFRGASKTTRLRTFASKRIAYGISRTILYVGASERDAIRSVQWLRTQVERNRFWAGTFGLKPGRKWEETQIEIQHETLGHTIWVLAAGITGSLRGINFDDYRPDLIIIDDPQTDEDAASEGQRTKISGLILGAVRNSLASEVEEPNAKLAMAITPQHTDDVSQKALKDPQWTNRLFPCWTQETLNLPVNEQISVWPELFPTESLRQRKRNAIRLNEMSVFAREMECQLISAENTAFRPFWLNVRQGPPPMGCFAVLGIDPVPPPSDREMAKGLAGKDYEAQYVWGIQDGQYHLLDFARSRGHQPSWSISTALTLARKWRVARIVVDSVAYQRTLKWLLEQEMRRRNTFYLIIPIADGMKKYARITHVFGGLAAEGKVWIGAEHSVFAEQFQSYGPTYTGHDDDLDASALAVQNISNPYLEHMDETGEDLTYSHIEEINFPLRCP